MKKHSHLFLTTSICILFFGITFTLIRTLYYNAFPSVVEYIFPLAIGSVLGSGLWLWRNRSIACRERLKEVAFDLSTANMELKQKNQQLEEIRQRLKQSEKMEVIGILAGGVAHDLNNILSGIVAYPDIMLQDLPEESPLAPPLLKIRQSGERASAIIQDLLTLGHGAVRYDRVVDPREVILQYLSSPEFDRLRALHPGLVVETDFNGGLLPVRGSWIHLYKVVMNLVSNAAEAMPDGGVIHISLESRYVDYDIENYEETQEGEYTLLTVSDTGHGIEARDLERIFEPFFTKKKTGRSGTGLGMAVVLGAVRDHKGYIEVKSSPGAGSRFRIYLPAMKQSCEVGKETPDDLSRRDEGKKRVLIVDDMEEQREITTAIVRKLGFREAAVPSGEAAIDYLKHHHADIMLLDFFLGAGINGLETYKRALSCRPGIKAISMSGFLEAEVLRELKQIGISEHLQKPLTPESVTRALERELGR